MKQKINYKWVLKVVALSFFVTIVFNLVSSILGGAGYIISFLLLLTFMTIGIVFDMIGIAVTSALPAPFHSMASHHERGAMEALRIIKNAEKTSSICNDIVSDISGVVSGALSVIIATRIISEPSVENIIVQLVISGLVTALTVGGKAIGKTIAINNSTKIVLAVGKVLSIKSGISSKK